MRAARACLSDLRYIRCFALLVSTISTALCKHLLLGSAYVICSAWLAYSCWTKYYEGILLENGGTSSKKVLSSRVFLNQHFENSNPNLKPIRDLLAKPDILRKWVATNNKFAWKKSIDTFLLLSLYLNILLINLQYIPFYSPKESSLKNSSSGSYCFCRDFTCFIVWKFQTPATCTTNVVGGCGTGA